MANELRMTAPTLKVLGAVMSAYGRELSGVEISRETGLASGPLLYPLLMRLEQCGRLEAAGRPTERLADHLAGGDVEGGEQGRGTMPLVVMRHGAAAALLQRQAGLVRSSAWIWLFSSTESYQKRRFSLGDEDRSLTAC